MVIKQSLSTELQAHGNRHLGDLARRREPPGLRVDLEDDDVVGVLVRDQQKFSGWVDNEVSRPFALGRNVFDERGLAGARVEREDDDAVVTTVRAVEKLSGRGDMDVRAIAYVGESRGKCGDGIEN